LTGALLGPGIWRARDRVQVAGLEGLEAERMEEPRGKAEDTGRAPPAAPDHIVAVVRVENREQVRAEVIEDREVVRGEGSHATRACDLVQRAATPEARHRVREAGAEEVREAGIGVGRLRIRIELDAALDHERGPP